MVNWKISPRRLVVPVRKAIICAPFIYKVFEISHYLHAIKSLADLVEILSKGDFTSSFFLYTAVGFVAAEDLYNYHSKWSERNQLIKSIFGNAFDPKFRKVEYDSGQHHEAYKDKIHPANRESIIGVVRRALPYHQKVLEGCKGYLQKRKFRLSEGEKKEIEEYLKFIRRNANIFERLIFQRIHLAGKNKSVDIKNSNIVCIGSPKSTYYSGKLMDYTEDKEPPSETPFRFLYDFNPPEYRGEYIIQILDGEIHPTKRYVIRDIKRKCLYGGKEDDVREFSEYKSFFERVLGKDCEEKIKERIKELHGEDTTPDQWYVLEQDYLMITRMPNTLSNNPEKLEGLIVGGIHGPSTMGIEELLKDTELLKETQEKIKSDYYQLIFKINIGYNDDFTYPSKIEGLMNYKFYDYTDFC